MKYKLSENGNIVVGEAGHPIVVKDDGSEIELRATELFTVKIPALNAESKKHREDKEKFEKLFNDLNGSVDGLNLEDAKKALEVVKGLESKDLINAGEANKKRDEITKEFQTTITNMQTEFKTKTEGYETKLKDSESKIFGLRVSDKFRGSKALKGTIFEQAPELAISYFGKNFKIEDDHVIGYANDTKIMNSDPNEFNKPATFDDALSNMLQNHPNAKNFKLAGGGGGGGNPAINNGAVVTATRAELQNATVYNAKVKEAGGIENIQMLD